ncbi:MAG: sigma-54-dependent Fis family transcriptional regulator [Lewinellaceae bacterium]|nr:sigma-54-dependent Fis family transcriptional regulator [Lewinella sp.]MCB9278329.1 sigma-54-dependent Fis family transcriptional regulator [Lewinellaceae bacterium]
MANNELQTIKQRYGIIGRNEALDRALSTALRVANTDLSVLITGESGTGKEIFSRIIHDNSIRKHNGFVAINCGAIPEGTINSELFGHEKGAFTGATGERKGYFETYNGGSIFLDEIGEMPLDTQSFLLRILETGEFIRVGSSKTLHTDVRIIAATNVDLGENIKKGKFREDLFYRLNTVPIHLPPLRERREDIYMLFRKFAIDFAEKYRMAPIQMDAEARRLLENYSWPGNIRELKNVAEQISILTEDREIDSQSLADLVPVLMNRNLPAIHASNGMDPTSINEREILYKVLFEMKNDLRDLKSLIRELIQNNDLQVSDPVRVKGLLAPTTALARQPAFPEGFHEVHEAESLTEEDAEDAITTMVVNNGGRAGYAPVETIDENLSISEHEKELIKKALKKHQGRRKEAAQDLGISERTLYRKIKEYDL